MDHNRAAKLALARRKLKDHQEKKHITQTSEEISNLTENNHPHPKDEHTYCINDFEDHKDNDHSVNLNHICESNELLLKPNEKDIDMNVVEILVSNKRNLELQVLDLQTNLKQLEIMLRNQIKEHNDSKLETNNLKYELQTLEDKYRNSVKQIHHQNDNIEELLALKSSLTDGNNNLLEQLELTKTLLTAKQTENAALLSQLNQLQSELDVSKLQLQQLMNGSNAHATQSCVDSNTKQSELHLRVESLENRLKNAQKEKDQLNLHYEHYVGELNQQVRSLTSRNEEMAKEVENFSNRELNLVDQIGEMEIRLQNMQIRHSESEGKKVENPIDEIVIQNKLLNTQKQLQEINEAHESLQKLIVEKDAKLEELQSIIKSNSSQDHISVTKLSADITSDKIAAQKATEQNKKLKTRMQELEEVFDKMNQDKLELTEKVTAEKFLNRELTIKLADSEEKYKDLHIKLRAKDDEMIRLQTSYRDLERKLENKLSSDQTLEENPVVTDAVITRNESTEILEQTTAPTNYEEHNIKLVRHQNHENESSSLLKSNNCIIPKERAMVKLQERFLRIMDEVANLSDEKHRLEHIILQLQNETDTICEYVALYQQQRCLLKKRDEERCAQIELFQVECDRLKNQLEELSRILLRFAEDQELCTYFQVESRQKDMEKVRSLLSTLQSNSLVDLKRTNFEINNVYPCSCCSGKLIDV